MRSFLRALAFAFALGLATLSSLVQSQILPIDSKPTAYHLKIDASDLGTSDTFKGAILVNITVGSTISSLLLHSENLTINESSVVMKKNPMFSKRWEKQEISNLVNNETVLNISFPSPLMLGSYSLYVEYLGYYQSAMAGFAKVRYHFKSEQKYLGVTGLKPTNARKVFPCYDSPGYRTPFTLEITVDKPYVAISNTRPTSVHSISETTKRVFLFHNPGMPVHQIGWAVLDQTTYALREENSTSTTIHTRAPFLYINQTAWANQLTARLVEAVGVYTGLEFGQAVLQGKIEQVVLPEFFVGTSEGYGFLSFSEDSILVSPDKSSARYIQNVGLTLARGVVQQWFGGIISIDSWEDSWMMEGLDQFLQYVIPESLSEMSGWELEAQAVELTQTALALDSDDSHPLAFQSDRETDLVSSALDSLSKYKGGALMRMLKAVFGSFFNEAMAMYIKNSYTMSLYNPSKPSMFWNMLYGAASEKEIDLAQQSLTEIMESWTYAPGYPVLSVTTNTTHFNISQSNSSMWWVPVSYLVQGSPNATTTWLQPGSFFTVQAPAAKWILVNVNQTGYYRVNYTSTLWKELSTQLSTGLTHIPRLSRAGLIDDAFALDSTTALELTGYLRAETDYFPWTTALRHYQALIYSMAGHSSYELLQNYLLDLMSGVIANVGFSPKPQDTHIDKLKRSLVLEKACEFGHKACIQKAVVNLKTWMAQTYYDPDLSSALLCAGVANSSAEVWHSVWSMYQYSLYPSVRLALLKSLTCTHDIDLLYQFLNNITSTRDPVVSFKDKTVLLETLGSKPFGAHVLLHWLVDRLQAQVNKTTPDAPVTEAFTSTTTANNASTENTTNRQIETKQSISSATAMPAEKLEDSDVITILNLILPRLRTLEEGTKLDSFLTLGNQTGLSDLTLETMQNATQRIYTQADQAMKLNAKLTVWLEAEAVSTVTGESTKTSTQTQPPHTTHSPSSAPVSTSGVTTLLVAMYLYVSMVA